MSSRRSQVSAGLLAFRRRPFLEVLLGHPGGPYWAKKDDGAWTIPKGVVEQDRNPLAAAHREFREETGFEAEGAVIPLHPVRVRSGKVVQGWAFEADYNVGAFHSIPFEMEWPPHSGHTASFPELDRLEWFTLERGLTKIIAYQTPLLLELRDLVASMDAPAPRDASRSPVS